MYERLTYLEKTNKQLADDKGANSPSSNFDILADNASLKQEVTMLKDRCQFHWNVFCCVSCVNV
jgi:hypothetical protein